ncbi:putative ribonuclease H-like domain-containing protein, partial [Tanacetum coccineum]
LVAQGFRQEEGIDYDEVFAPVARIEAISAFLYGTIEEEVYVHQPPGFVDLAHPNKVYKVIKDLYGLHQAPKAWYETLSSFLMENGFRRGIIDKTLFIKKKKSDIMLPDGIFISQDKYMVWILVDLPFGKKAIGTKWVFRNKRDESSIIVKNKARLVAQGFRQEEGIDYDEVFAPVSRIEAIRLFLAFASLMGFPVYQMDVKSAFLYGTIGEEVYLLQPSGFVDPAHPNKVYKVIKALYGLHQAPRAWYETLSSFLLENGFRRGTIEKTLVIKKNKSD